MEDTDGLTVTGGMEQENVLKYNAVIWVQLTKFVWIVKLFKRSPLKNEILQAKVEGKHPNGLQLILDCKTH